MLAPLRIATLAALAALVVTGSLSVSYAATCETQLKGTYKCSATFDVGGSAEYCLRPYVETPGDGQFWLVEAETNSFYCSCDAKGRFPDVQFGASSRDFFCGSFSDIAFAGRASGGRITGQGYTLDGGALRSAVSCQAVATCP
jgi:hypothetical protein